MSTSAVTGVSAKQASDMTERTKSQELGQDEFLQILAAQLANQDPLQPMEDTDFIAQMAQFSSLEQMQDLNNSFSSFQANSLIGKNVLGSVTDDSGNVSQIYGEVTGVVRYDETDYLQIGEYLVPYSAVSAIYDDDSMDAVIAQSSNLVGKQVEATVPAENSEDEAKTISGTVDSILVKKGLLYAAIGEEEVPVAYITKISEE